MLNTLYEKKGTTGRSVLTPALRRFYGGGLVFPNVSDRAYVVGNFVQGVDGPVTFGKGNKNLLFGCREDRLVMSILRALADAVIVGKETLLDDPPGATWHWKTTTPEGEASTLREFARHVGKRETQKNVFVSATGAGFDFSRSVFHDSDVQAVIATTTGGANRLKKDIEGLSVLPRVAIWSLDDASGGVDLKGLIAKLWQGGSRFVLIEGGPALYGSFEAENLLDELFLTQRPMIVGNGKDAPRPTVSGFSHREGKLTELVSIKKGVDDVLFFRHRYSRK